MTSVITWIRAHSSAILVTAIAVAKSGALGKAGLIFVSAVAAACGATI